MRLAIIPARGGSVRIPGKNTKPFFGKPIIAYSIETAQKSGLFDMIVVSTDCSAIADVAKQYGAQVFERPMDDGTRGTQEVAREVLLDPGYANVRDACVIYATSPMLLPIDLKASYSYMKSWDAFYAMSVNANPLSDAGCFYWGSANSFRKGLALIGPWTIMYPLPAERCCDINTPEDWAKAEQLYQRMREKQ